LAKREQRQQGKREQQVPVTRRTMFRWASISKPITAGAAMQLWERGSLDIESEPRRYVTECPDKEAPIRVRSLFCHLGGIVHYTNGKVIRTRRDYTVENPFESVIYALDTFRESPLVNAPGEKFAYTTHGFILLSAVVERTGEGQQPAAGYTAGHVSRSGVREEGGKLSGIESKGHPSYNPD